MASIIPVAIRPAMRFSPVRLSASTAGTRPVGGVIFDLDGTLCKPQRYMFDQMREAIEADQSVDILEYVQSLSENDRAEAIQRLQTVELNVMKEQEAQEGLGSVMDYLTTYGVRKGILTRNHGAPVQHLISKFIPKHSFEPIVTRDFHPPKPDPAGINHIAHSWGLPDASSVIMVGDSMDDMAAGRLAGAVTVLVSHPYNGPVRTDARTDMVIERLDELIPILEGGFQVAPARIE